MARKILLADDSVTAQNMGRKILADAGYEVITVNNGSAALKKIADLKPDVVILDVYMPGYSGLEVCQRLKESADSSRIPVLLTVGKLEPFKPEEAHRVRADAFIVKPFEASELLSALSKLEDKVVPRAEPSKPGRFARAFAAQEEASRGGRIDQTGDDNGWKSRISFPHEKKESEEKVADDPAIYNPVNRDLRTVVETPAELAAEKAAEQAILAEDKRHPAQAVEPSVDLAALAPPGLPQDVTPEEVAAIAAAAAQLQTAMASSKEGSSSAPASPAPVEQPAEPVAVAGLPSEVSAPQGPAPHARRADSKQRRRWDDDSDGNAEDVHDVPATMAVTPLDSATAAKDGQRWTAVPVALEPEEAEVSLEHEMQKAYSAFVAQEKDSRPADSPATSAATESVAAQSDSPSTPDREPDSKLSPTETPAAGISLASPVEASESASFSTSAEIVPAPSERPVIGSTSASAEFSSESHYATDAVGQATAVMDEPASAEIPNKQAETEHHQAKSEAPAQASAEFVADVQPQITQENSQTSETQITTQGQTALVETPSAESMENAAPAAELRTEENRAEQFVSAEQKSDAPYAEVSRPEENPQDSSKPELTEEESATVRNTAAAWATWRHIRDTSPANAVPAPPMDSNQQEIGTGSAPTDSAAMAVAAGAEQALRDVSPSSENPGDIASIVDSVLADLRPKLMAEISRKMSEKK